MEGVIKPEEIRQRLLNCLKEKGLKLTPQRREIIEILSSEKSHPSARTIFQKAREKAPTISMSTVYYTLDIFKKYKAIKELEFYDMENRYEGDISNHLNLICIGCGKIQDFKEGLPFSQKVIEEKTGFKPYEMRFEYYGYCKECNRHFWPLGRERIPVALK